MAKSRKAKKARKAKVKVVKKTKKIAKAVRAAGPVKQVKQARQPKANQKGEQPLLKGAEAEELVTRVMPKQIIKASPEEVQDIPVTSVMRKGVIVIESDKVVGDGARAMMKNRIGSVIVTEKGKAIGILTERDIVRKLVARDRVAAISIKEVMSTPIRVIEEDKTVKDAVILMKRYGIKRLPVMDKKKRLIGIVTDTDITSALPGMMDLTIELSKISRFETGIESVGICNNCGMWSESLQNVGGEFLCEECRQEEEEQCEE